MSLDYKNLKFEDNTTLPVTSHTYWRFELHLINYKTMPFILS